MNGLQRGEDQRPDGSRMAGCIRAKSNGVNEHAMQIGPKTGAGYRLSLQRRRGVGNTVIVIDHILGGTHLLNLAAFYQDCVFA